MSRSIKCLLVLTLQVLAVRATCYFRDGSVAGSNYSPCPGQNFCCASDQKCTASGVCQAAGNNLPDTTSIFTYLYTSPACTRADFLGCQTQCTNVNVAKVAPIWACDNGLTDFCCHVSQSPLPDPRSCCNTTGALFLLPAAIVIPWDSAVSAATASSSTAHSSNPATSASTATSSLASSSTASSASGTTTTLPPLLAFTSGATFATLPPAVSNSAVSAAATASTAASSMSGMSQGTQIGIGVGVAVGVVFLAILAALFWRVQSLQGLLRKDNEGHGEVRMRGAYEPAPTYDDAIAGARAEKTPAVTAAPAMAPPAPAEADATGQIHEMPSHFRSELP